MKKPGYILMLTLLMTSIAVALISMVVQQSFAYQRQARLAANKARTRLLTISSLALVESQISLILEQESATKASPQSKQESGDKKDELEPIQQWLLKLLGILNRWQTLTLTDDGLEGEIRYYIVSEQGKIPLSLFEDELFQEGQEKKEQEQPTQNGANGNNERRGNGQRGSPDDGKKTTPLTFFNEIIAREHAIKLRESLKSFVESARRMPEDITELLTIPTFKTVAEPFFVEREVSKKPFYLMDLFTAQKSKGINPWLLSASLKTVLGIASTQAVAPDKAVVKKMKERMRWAQEWDKVLAPIYGKKLEALGKGFENYLADEFVAQSFSVVSYCTVDGITLGIYALFERTEPGPDSSPKSQIFKATKLYWLS